MRMTFQYQSLLAGRSPRDRFAVPEIFEKRWPALMPFLAWSSWYPADPHGGPSLPYASAGSVVWCVFVSFLREKLKAGEDPSLVVVTLNRLLTKPDDMTDVLTVTRVTRYVRRPGPGNDIELYTSHYLDAPWLEQYNVPRDERIAAFCLAGLGRAGMDDDDVRSFYFRLSLTHNAITKESINVAPGGLSVVQDDVPA